MYSVHVQRFQLTLAALEENVKYRCYFFVRDANNNWTFNETVNLADEKRIGRLLLQQQFGSF